MWDLLGNIFLIHLFLFSSFLHSFRKSCFQFNFDLKDLFDFILKSLISCSGKNSMINLRIDSYLCSKKNWDFYSKSKWESSLQQPHLKSIDSTSRFHLVQ
jgi:hypothetical protein